jgi:transposase
MTQKRSYKQYPKEFKEEAVALVTEQGYIVPKAAEAFGCSTQYTLSLERQCREAESWNNLVRRRAN